MMSDNARTFLEPSNAAEPSWFQQQCRRMLFRRLSDLNGRLVIEEAGISHSFGDDMGISAHIEVKDPDFFSDIALRGSLGAAKAWMDGTWSSQDLTQVFAILAQNPALTDGFDRGWSQVAARAASRFHEKRRNSPRGSRQNIADHYDLGNALFDLFLDRSMNYSSAFFNSDRDSLDTAGQNKLERICNKLSLDASHHVLEVGCGWGGFAIHAASRFGCRVTGITISQEQFEFAKAKVIEADLTDQVEIVLCDYRDHQGQYDRVVSIEMIEAVGQEFLGDYFSKIQSFLKDNGAALLQAITMPDQRYAQYLKGCDFIQRYIFPGSCVPSLGAINEAVRQRTDLKLVDLEDIAPHYAETLRRWRDNFNAHREEIRALGYPERFIRLWNYYFCYCEAGFDERYLSDLQIVLTRPKWRGEVPRRLGNGSSC